MLCYRAIRELEPSSRPRDLEAIREGQVACDKIRASSGMTRDARSGNLKVPPPKRDSGILFFYRMSVVGGVLQARLERVAKRGRWGPMRSPLLSCSPGTRWALAYASWWAPVTCQEAFIPGVPPAILNSGFARDRVVQ